MVIVDEAQTIENDRGYLIELLLMKLHLLNPNVQVVFLSATLPCPLQLSSWLSATLFIYESHFSQVSSQKRNNLIEYTVMNNKVFYSNDVIIHDLSNANANANSTIPNAFQMSKKPSNKMTVQSTISLLIQWLFQTNKDNTTMLVFCPTKARCEDLVKSMSSIVVYTFI